MDVRLVKKGRAVLHAAGPTPINTPLLALPELRNNGGGATVGPAGALVGGKPRLIFPTCESDIFYLRLRQTQARGKGDNIALLSGGRVGQHHARPRQGTRGVRHSKSPIAELPHLKAAANTAPTPNVALSPTVCASTAPLGDTTVSHELRADNMNRLSPTSCSYNRTKRIRQQKLDKAAAAAERMRPRTEGRRGTERRLKAFEMGEEDMAFRSYLKSANIIPR